MSRMIKKIILWSMLAVSGLVAVLIFPHILHAEEDDVYRLIVKTDSEQLWSDDALIAQYDDLYLLQYDDARSTMKAMDELIGSDSKACVDICISIASDETWLSDEEQISESVMTEDDNPFSKLNDLNETEVRTFDIALIDTGAALNKNVIEALSVIGDDGRDDNGHGTRMAEHIISQDQDVRILSIKALDQNGKGDMSALIAAIKLAMIKGAKVINLSVCASARSENEVLAEVVKDAVESGVIVVGAAGNYGSDASGFVPANIDEALIVGASDDNGHIQPSSNYGRTVDLYMPASSTSEAAALMSGWLSCRGCTIDIAGYPEEALNADEIMDALYHRIVNVSETDSGEVEICEPVYEPDLYWYPVRADNYIQFTAGVAGEHNYRLMWRADWWDNEGGPSDSSYEWKSLAYCVQPDNQEFPRWVDISHPSTDASEDMKWATISAVLLLAPYADGGTFYNADGLDGVSLYGLGGSYITIVSKGSYFTGHASDSVLKDILFAHMIVGRLYNGSWSSHAGTELQSAGDALIASIQNKLADTSSLMYKTVKAAEVTLGDPNTQIGDILPSMQQKVTWVKAGEQVELTGGFAVSDEVQNGHGILKILKKISGGRVSDAGEEFTFTLTADKSGIKYRKYNEDGIQVTLGAGSGNGTSITSGRTFTLKAGQYVLIDMPAGCSYTVSENDTGGLYTNETEGSVSGKISEATQTALTFTYTVRIKDENGRNASGITVSYSGRIDGSSQNSGTKTTDSSGRFTFTLVSGRKVEFADIPEGYTYTVSVSANSGYTITTPDEASGTIDAEHVPEAAFIHTYEPGQVDGTFVNTPLTTGVTICKVSDCSVSSLELSGSLYSENLLDAQFRIRVYDRISGNLIYDAVHHPTSFTLENNGSIRAVLDPEDAQSVVRVNSGSIDKLFAGDKVTVTETKAPAGFLLPHAAALLNEGNVSDTQTISSLSSNSDDNIFIFTDVPAFSSLEVCKYKAGYLNDTLTVGQGTDRQPVYDQEHHLGPVFLMEYYDNYSCSGTPVRYWYFIADSSGRWSYEAAYLLSDLGNSEFMTGGILTCQIPENCEWEQLYSLYRDADGNAGIPLGSFSIREVWAPAGYEIFSEADGKPVVIKGRNVLKNDPQLNAIVPQIEWITDISALDETRQYAQADGNRLTLGDREISLAIRKSDSMNEEPVEGVTFEITDVNDSSRTYSVISGADGRSLVCSGFLEVGHTYVMKETETPDGYVLNEDEVFFYVGTDGAIHFEDWSDSLGDHNVPEVRHILEETGSDGRPQEVYYRVQRQDGQNADYEISYSEEMIEGTKCCVLNIANEPNRLRIIKSGLDKTSLAGVEFSVRAESLDENDTESIIAYRDSEYSQPFRNGDILVTDDLGEAYLYRLKSDDVMIITEIQTADELSLLADPVYLKVTESGRLKGTMDRDISGKTYRYFGNESRTDGNIVYDLYIDNMPVITLMTGGDGSIRFCVAGLCLAAAAMCYAVIRKKEHHASKNRKGKKIC